MHFGLSIDVRSGNRGYSQHRRHLDWHDLGDLGRVELKLSVWTTRNGLGTISVSMCACLWKGAALIILNVAHVLKKGEKILKLPNIVGENNSVGQFWDFTV